MTVGSGWAIAVDALTWAAAAALMAKVRLAPAAQADRGQSPSMLRELAEGWSAFTSLAWVWIVVLAFGLLNAIHAGAWFTLGPAIAKDTIGEAAGGWVLSAEAAGLLAMTVVMMRLRLKRPLRAGMLGMCAFAVPILVLGIHPAVAPLVLLAFVSGCGMEVFGIGWQTAYHEHIPQQLLSRVASYDALGSFVAIPLGQLAFGPLAAAFGAGRVLVVAGIGYIAIAASTLLSRSVRDLGRAGGIRSPT